MNKKLFIVLILSIILSSCIKDNGNYEYIQVNSVSINLDSIPTYIDQFDTLTILPKFTQTLRNSVSNDNLKCLWILEGKQGLKLKDTISTDTICKAPILLPPGDYNGTLYVRDVDTELFYKATFSIKINSYIGQGLLVLSEIENEEADLSYIKYESGSDIHPVFTNVYSSANNHSLGSKPKSIWVMWPASASGDVEKILINCNDNVGGKIIDMYTFSKIGDIKDYFFLPPSPMKAVDIIFNNSQLLFPPSATTSYYSVCAGKLFNAQARVNIISTELITINGVPYMLFKPALTFDNNKTSFPLTPYLDGNIVGHGYASIAFWDKNNHCFTYTADRKIVNKCYYNANTNVSNLKFDPINLTGYDLIKTGPFYRGNDSRTTGNSYAIVKDQASNKLYCLLIQKKSTNELLPKDPYIVEIVDDNSHTPALDNNSCFLGSVFTYDLYFSIGNKLFQKGLTTAIPTTSARLIWEAPAGTTITTIHGEALYDSGFSSIGMSTTGNVKELEIYVGVYDPNVAGKYKGSVYRFKVSDGSGLPVQILTNGWPKLNCAGKVVSMIYKGD